MVVLKNPKQRCIDLEPATQFPSGFFDGASANSNGGVGVYLLINCDHSFSINMGCGQSNNTRSEILALWALLVVAKEFGIPSLHIRGDSSIIINRVKGRSALSSLNLDGWCQNIRHLESSFLSFDFSHVYREYNKKADGLSKEALSMASGLLQLT